MYMIRSNPHTHTDYVDGKSPARDMIKRALELGFTSLGFSEHAYQPDIEPLYGLTDPNRQRYINEIVSLRREYEGRIRIWLGLEIDRMSPESGEGLDYFIGANHYLTSRNGDFAAVDGDADLLEAYVARAFDGSWDRAIERYFKDYADFVEKKPPAIIAHFDLICKSNRKRHWFREDGALIDCGKVAMRRMIRSCRVLEVNTGGMARSGQPCPYPVQPLLAFWRELGGQVIPSSDCHRAHQLDAFFDIAPEYMRAAGFTECLALGKGDRLFETVSLL
ncbi:MAG: histidinol-phosphatase HisJ family protein [Clostridia bacterium]|nr:histidinol-phosphatase HisJ family protein [Clostridia bacterium]